MTGPPAPTQPLTLSVVIPCLNDAELLDRCLRSFGAQLRPADEILVVDNGSVDGSGDVARAHGARVVDEPRRGITWAVRTGFDEALGDVLVRTDADVHVAPDFLLRLERVWHAAMDTPGRTIVGVTGSGRFDRPGLAGDLASALYLGAYRRSFGSALGHHPLFGSNFSVRADWWKRVREDVDVTDTLVHEDMHLSYAVGSEETVWYQPDLVVGMDDRALRGLRQGLTRLYRGFYTIAQNWGEHPPHRRLARRGHLGPRLQEAWS